MTASIERVDFNAGGGRRRAAVRRLHNRAVFEVPEILADLLAQAQEQAEEQPVPAPAGAESRRHLASPREPSTCPIG